MGVIPTFRPCLGADELDAIARVFDSRWLGYGDVTQAFERELAEYLGVRRVVAVNSGTAALHLALEGLGLQAGDEVIVPSLTFVSTVQAIVLAGATPVFCEVDPDTLCLDVEDVARRVTARTRSVVPVHYGGAACDLDGLRALASAHHLRIVEDAAQAFGSSWRGTPIGASGNPTCFSFDPIKNLTCGDGGAIATDDEALAQRILPRRNVGIDRESWRRFREPRDWRYSVVSPGYRYLMNNMSAAIGLTQMKRLPEFLARKLAIVRQYDAAFTGLHGLQLLRRDWTSVFPFSYVVRVLDGRRDAMLEFLRLRGVMTMIQFPPNHLQPAFSAWRIPLPVTESLFDEILTLPLYHEMSGADVGRVAEGVQDFLRAPARRRAASS